ncbi:mucin-2 isoform X4 [Engraulis encrasicolus]|uniref:mucin-2 isoform X4 n=1 Tax=Engraulis encrasicolus TaxID=184585 RepID=UPI002FD29A59
MSSNENDAGAINKPAGNAFGCVPLARSDTTNAVPVTAERSRGVAYSPSPNKTGAAGMPQMICSIVDETPPWNRTSFLYSSFCTSFQGSPLGTSRLSLTPSLRRLCLDGSPAASLGITAEHQSLLAQATSFLDNESPPWDSVLDESLSMMPANLTVGTESCTSGGTVAGSASPLPDVVTSAPQDATVDMEDEGSSLTDDTAPEVSAAGKSSTIHSACNDTTSSTIQDRTATPMNSTMELPGGGSTTAAAGVTSDIIASPAKVMNGTVDLQSSSSSSGEVNQTVDVSSHNVSANVTATLSYIATPANEGNRTMEMVQQDSLTINTVNALSNVASSGGQLNSTVEVASCNVSTREQMNTTGPAAAALQIMENTQDLQDNPRSSTPDVSTKLGTEVNPPMPVANGTLNLTHECSSTGAALQNMDNTVDLQTTPRSSTPTLQNNTMDLQNNPHSSTTSSQNNTLELQSTSNESSGGSTTIETSVPNGTMNLTQSSATVAVVQKLDSTVDLENSSSSSQITAQHSTASHSTAHLSSCGSTTIEAASRPNSIVNDTVSSTHGRGSMEDTVDLPNITHSSSSSSTPSVSARGGTAGVNLSISVANGTVNLTPAVAQKMDNTVDLHGTPAVSARLGAAAAAAVGLPTPVANTTGNLTYDSSSTPAVVRKMDNTVDLHGTPGVSARLGAAAAAVSLPTPVANGTVNLTCNSSSTPVVAGEMDNTVDLHGTLAVSVRSGTAAVSFPSPAANGTVNLTYDPSSTPAVAVAEKMDHQVNLHNATTDGPSGHHQPHHVDNKGVSDGAPTVAAEGDSELNSTADSVVVGCRLSGQFSLDHSLEMQAFPPVTSTPMVTDRKFSFEPALKVPKMAALQGTGLPSLFKAGPSSSTTVVVPPPPQGSAAAAAKTSGLPTISRRNIAKPPGRAGVSGIGTAANVTVEVPAGPSGLQRPSTRLPLGMKGSLRNAASAISSAHPETAQQRRLSLAPLAALARGKKRPNEGAGEGSSKDTTAAAGPMPPPRASTGLKRPMAEAREGPAKRPKEVERAQALAKDSAPTGKPPARTSFAPPARTPAAPPARTNTVKLAAPSAPSSRPLRASTSRTQSLSTAQPKPSLGLASRLRSSFSRKRDSVLPAVPEDPTSATYIQHSTLSASHVGPANLTQSSTTSAECTIAESECKNCKRLKEIIQQLQEQLNKRHPH